MRTYPVNDLIDQDTDSDQPDCVCGPAVEHVPYSVGPDGWVIVHNSLDGREESEAQAA